MTAGRDFRTGEAATAPGFFGLGFDPATEAAYRRHHLEQARWRVLMALLLTMALNVGMVQLNLTGPPGEMPPTFKLLRDWVVQPLGVLMLVVGLYRPLYFRWWLVVGPVAFIAGGVLTAPSGASKVASGNHHAFLSVVTGLFLDYALTGFLLRRTLAVTLSISTAYLYFLLRTDVAPGVLYYEAMQLLVINVIGVSLLYTLEYTSRAEFRRTRELEHLSTRDPLTALANRRSFSQHLDRLWAQGLRDRQAVGLMLIDVDCFKNYNDRYGHQAGDECLRRVAAAIAELERRPLDLAARVGGEEFAVLMYGPTREYLEGLARQVNADVQRAAIPHASSLAARHVTVSVGTVFAVPDERRSPTGLYQFADQMLYEAKRQGRNRVQVGDPGSYAALQTGRFGTAGTAPT